MQTFTDNEKRSWTIHVTVDAVKRVRTLLGVNLLEVIEGGLLERFIRDPVLLCDVIYAVCKPEADSKGITDEQFGRAMAGDAIDGASKALLGGLVDFFPSAQDRANLRRVLDTTWKVLDRARQAVSQRLEAGELEKVVESALPSASAPSGSAPASSASTPDP